MGGAEANVASLASFLPAPLVPLRYMAVELLLFSPMAKIVENKSFDYEQQ
jgi:hypothetical protein